MLKTFAIAAEDGSASLMYLLKYRNDFKLDPSKIILFESKAGAETILNLTNDKNIVINQNYIIGVQKIAAVISVSGATVSNESHKKQKPH